MSAATGVRPQDGSPVCLLCSGWSECGYVNEYMFTSKIKLDKLVSWWSGSEGVSRSVVGSACVSVGGTEQGVSYETRRSPGQLCASLNVCVPVCERECNGMYQQLVQGGSLRGLYGCKILSPILNNFISK